MMLFMMLTLFCRNILYYVNCIICRKAERILTLISACLFALHGGGARVLMRAAADWLDPPLDPDVSVYVKVD